MQLIAIGDNVINLDQVTVLDIDPLQTGAFVVRVFAGSSQPVIEINIPRETANTLINMVGSGIRVAGADDRLR